jgi:hypothetical protein
VVIREYFVNFVKYNRPADRGESRTGFLHCRIATRCICISGCDFLSDGKTAIGYLRYFWRILRMKFLSNNYKKYVAAAATVVAAIAIPAQATDCTTTCQNAAAQAGSAAQMQAAQKTLAFCMANWSANITGCMSYYSPQFQQAYDQAYQQTLSQCTGSCH